MIFKGITAFLFSMFAALNSSNAFEIKRSNDQLYLYDTSCDAVENSTVSLANWAKSTNSNSKCPIDNLKPERNSGMCSVNITNCVPDHVRQYQGQYSAYGPNCYNLALVFKGILPALRYSTQEEISFYMKPPICQKIQKSNLKPGDVGIIKATTSKQPDHAFIYISKDLIYNKPNGSEHDPYQVTTYSKMFSQQKAALSRYEDVDLKTTFYRCQSMESYLASAKNVPEEILHSLNNIKSFERCFESKTARTNSSALPEAAKKSLLDTTKILAEYLKQEVNQTNIQKDEKTQFLLGSLQLRLQAISAQLNIQSFYNRDSDLESLKEKLNPLQEVIQKSLEKLGLNLIPQEKSKGR